MLRVGETHLCPHPALRTVSRETVTVELVHDVDGAAERCGRVELQRRRSGTEQGFYGTRVRDDLGAVVRRRAARISSRASIRPHITSRFVILSSGNTTEVPLQPISCVSTAYAPHNRGPPITDDLPTPHSPVINTGDLLTRSPTPSPPVGFDRSMTTKSRLTSGYPSATMRQTAF